MDQELSKRINVTRYLMVIGIIILHIPPYQSLSDLGLSPFELIKGFFSNGLFRATVPVLTVLSGYMVFKTGLYAQPRRLVSKKVKNLLIPLIAWNIPLVLIVYFIQRYGLLSHDFSVKLSPVDDMSWLNATLGITASPINFPLNFLRDLFVITLLSPLFGILLTRAPYIGLALVCLIYIFNADGAIVLRNSMLISFYVGGMAAVRLWDLTRLDRLAWPLLLLLLLICLWMTVYDIENREVFRLLSPFLVWPAISLIMNTPLSELIHRYAPTSFLTFLCHGPLLIAMWVVFKKLPSGIPYVIFWLLAPVFTLLLCVAIYRTLKRFAPSLGAIILGNR